MSTGSVYAACIDCDTSTAEHATDCSYAHTDPGYPVCCRVATPVYYLNDSRRAVCFTAYVKGRFPNEPEPSPSIPDHARG